MKKFFLALFVFGIMFSFSVKADEGMWLPSLIQKLNINQMQKEGCELSTDDIYSINHSSLKDAVVALDHGSCTAEMISEKGLLLTNHHCGFGEIQAHSSVEHDYLKNGFWAKNYGEELPNPGKTVSFLIRMEDVTDSVMKNLSDTLSEEERESEIQNVSFRIQKAAMDSVNEYSAMVKPLFDNNRYFLFVYQIFRDVRLVGAPPVSIGKFGGDTDNWMWPRHTGDFSIFRVYCSPDGKPADYSKENVPFHPKFHFTVSLNGYNKNSFAMIMGYPGRTSRYKTSYGVNYTMAVTNPVRIQVRKAKLDILNQYMKTSEKARIQYASKYAISSNYYKYSIGQNKGLNDLHIIDQKKSIEDRFTKWVNMDESRKVKYGEALGLIKKFYANSASSKAYEYIVESMLMGPEIFYTCFKAKGLELSLKDGDSKDRIENNVANLREKMKNFYKDYDATTDAKVSAELFKLYADNVDPKYYPSFIATVEKKYHGDYDKFTDKIFKKSVFTDKARLESFLNNPSYKRLKKDPVFQVSNEMFRELIILGGANDGVSVGLEKGERLYLEGLMKMEKNHVFYPDANSTMRLTYGKVGGYKPHDGVKYDYYTTIKGYIEKEIPGDDEFSVPQKLKDLYRAKDFGRYADKKDSTLHTCFITNNDITGGNSGSPVLNANGQLIGIAFDGNWEAMSCDIAYEPVLQKCVNVDIRFVMWIIDKYAGAKNIIDEITFADNSDENQNCLKIN
ncbi:MAG: S46 family peptidase [Prolixibacteraceae bacterium]|nr:S46 family peptidase [Prolixibacteraceae bacterium]